MPEIKSEEPKKTATKKLLPLLLLVILAGGAYFQFQNGGLEPILQMVGLAEPPPPPPAPPVRSQPAQPVKKPQQILGGTLEGQPFKAGFVSYAGGILTLQNNQNDKTSSVAITLPLKNRWETPEVANYTADSQQDGKGTVVDLSWTPAGALSPEQKKLTDGYTLNLKLTQVKGNSVSGNIVLSTNSQPVTSITGNFNAVMQGFRTVNGKPDLKSDSNETLMYVALAHLLADDKHSDMSNVMYYNPKYTDAGSGSLEVEYKLGQKTHKKSFEFEKDLSGWVVRDVK